MTAIQPGLNARDSAILELLRGGATVDRVIAIGRHRKSWNPVHVGALIAFHYGEPVRTLRVVKPKPTPRKVAECGSPSGYRRHQRIKKQDPTHETCAACTKANTDDCNARAAKRRAESGVAPAPSLPVWTPEPFTGRPADVRLRPAQVDVLVELCRGLSNRRIGMALGLSEDTVKCHVKDILAATGAVDRTHVVVQVLSGQVRILGEPRRAAS